MKKYKFSVVMAIYNVYPYLEKAILSVVNQTVGFEKNVQLILVNDGSPDNSEKICEKYKLLFPNNVIYISKKNGGVSSARNAGLKIADGEYINFLDSDDYFSENAFEKVEDFIKNYSNCNVVALNLINFENSSGSWVNKDFFKKTQLIDLMSDSNFMQCQVGASFIKREYAKKITFDTKIKIHEDSHYLYRIFALTPLCGVISDATYWHRIRNNGTSATQTINVRENTFSLMENVFIDLIEYYNKTINLIPNFLQTFIILEFNYYICQNFTKVKFSNLDNNRIIKDVDTILKNIFENNINNHFVLDSFSKENMVNLKSNPKRFLEIYKTQNFKVKITEKLCTIKMKFKNKLCMLKTKIKKKNVNEIFIAYDNWISFIEKSLNETTEKYNELKEKVLDLNLKINEYENKLQNNEQKINEYENKLQNNEQKINEYENKLQNNEQKINEYSLIIQEYKAKNKMKENKKIDNFLYFHSGSKNHGCEAIVKSLTKKCFDANQITFLQSFRKMEDITNNLYDFVDYIEEPSITNQNNDIKHMGDCKFNLSDMGISNIKKNLDDKTIAFSIGGDNYCYGESVVEMLSSYNSILYKNQIKTVLFDCSIEPTVLNNSLLLKNLNLYTRIIARESLTYGYLKEKGLNNVVLIPDIAFLLDVKKTSLPSIFETDVVGINASPLMEDYINSSLFKENIVKLIEYILFNTNYNIVLIPHVFWDKSNDYEYLKEFYLQFSYTGRISIVDEQSCNELKYIISKCKIFVGARTHSTIAAYSSKIPTLALGYSVKSKGIAKDIFGSYEKYVLDVKNIKNSFEILESFKWIDSQYDIIKSHLDDVIPEYIISAKENKTEIDKIRNENLKKQIAISSNCTGCLSCKSICPQKCINDINNNDGFVEPIIDYNNCIDCKKCIEVCPINKTYDKQNILHCFAAQAKEKSVLLKSSSGGIFYFLANEVIKNSGVVVGAKFDENFNLYHEIITHLDELELILGSKYLQSNLNNVFNKIKLLLKQNTTVLFSGTPCQVQGLKSFLGQEYENLLCVDFICHGVAPQKIFDLYIKSYNKCIINYEFREKSNGWNDFQNKISFKDKTIESKNKSESIYMKGYLNNLFLRESCYNCPANNFKSGSDITLGDFWGCEDILKDINSYNGVSAIIIKTNKGKELFQKIDDNILKEKINIIDIVKNNIHLLNTPKNNKNRYDFFNSGLDSNNIKENILRSIYDIYK